MSGIVNKIKTIFSDHNDYYDEEEIIDELYDASQGYQGQGRECTEYPHQRVHSKSNLKVVAHPNAGSYEVKVIEPKSFEEALSIVNNLRDKKSVILNLHFLDSEQSQRIVDFISGAAHAVDGHQQKIGEKVFLFTPSNVCISMDTHKAAASGENFWSNIHIQ